MAGYSCFAHGDPSDLHMLHITNILYMYSNDPSALNSTQEILIYYQVTSGKLHAMKLLLYYE